MKIDLIGFLLVVLLPSMLIGQMETVITGYVTSKNGDRIIGANVFIADSYDGTSTDSAGYYNFSTDLTGEQLLQCSYLGFKTLDVPIQLNGDTIYLNLVLKEDAFEMQEVVITAGSFEAGGESKREVLKPLDIVTTAGATADISGALNTLPGTVTVGESGRLFVRGGEGYETKTFIDGIQVLNFYSPTAPNTPSRSRFLPFMFRGASFSTGGYSAEYGQALSSALILNSKPIATTERVDISLLSVGGDISFTEAWDNASFSGKLQYTNIDPYFSVINQEIDWVDPPTSIEGMMAYRIKLGNKGILKLYGNINSSSFTLNQKDLLDPEKKIRTKIKNNYKYLNANVSTALKNDWSLYTGVSFTHNIDDLELDIDQVNEVDWGLHTKFRFKKNITDNISLNVGAEQFLRSFIQDFEDPGNEFTNRFDLNENLSAAFIESDIHLSTHLLARIGIRSEFRSETNCIDLAPRISLAFKTGENGQVSAAYGRFQQQPQNQWLMISNKLDYEQATHYIINYQVSESGRTFRIEAYHKEYDRLVKFESESMFTPQGYINQGDGKARGFDLFWRDSRSISQLDYWISYSFLDTERDYLDFPHAVTPSFASSHNLSIVTKYFINELKAQVGGTYTFASGRPYEDPNSSGFMTDLTPAYHDLSLNFSYLFKENIILHTSVSNVLGRDHIFGYNYSDKPDQMGIYPGKAIKAPAKRFLFLGIFVTFSKQQILNQLPNL